MWDWGLGFGVQGSGLGTFKFKVHESGFLPYELRPSAMFSIMSTLFWGPNKELH